MRRESKWIQDLFIHARTAILTQLKNVTGRWSNSSNNRNSSSSYNHLLLLKFNLWKKWEKFLLFFTWITLQGALASQYIFIFCSSPTPSYFLFFSFFPFVIQMVIFFEPFTAADTISAGGICFIYYYIHICRSEENMQQNTNT